MYECFGSSESLARHVLIPVDDLLKSVIVTCVARKGVGVHQTTDGVSALVHIPSASNDGTDNCTDQVVIVRIQFAFAIIRSNVDLHPVDETRDLVGHIGEHRVPWSVFVHQATTSASVSLMDSEAPTSKRFCSQRGFLKTVVFLAEETYHGCLTHELLVLRGRIADANLRSADGRRVGVDLIRLVEWNR